MEKLQRILQYKFKDPSLLETALKHRSLGANNNQRLEFLGDAVLQLVITDALFAKFAKADEGVLTRLRASLVCGKALSEIATELQLSDHLILSSGERKSNGHNRLSTLADALEAIIGAVYLDSNIGTCRAWILNLYKNKLAAIDEPVLLKDPKTLLQEIMQAKKIALPVYQVISSVGEDHNKIFNVAATITLVTYEVIGSGTSIRGAEQDAARKILELLDEKL